MPRAKCLSALRLFARDSNGRSERAGCSGHRPAAASVAIFGSTDPAFFTECRPRSRHRVLGWHRATTPPCQSQAADGFVRPRAVDDFSSFARRAPYNYDLWRAHSQARRHQLTSNAEERSRISAESASLPSGRTCSVLAETRAEVEKEPVSPQLIQADGHLQDVSQPHRRYTATRR
jgi:hypothetical protein